jgi:hypothetical protein
MKFKEDDRVYHTKRCQYGTFVRYDAYNVDEALVDFDNGDPHYVSVKFLEKGDWSLTKS